MGVQEVNKSAPTSRGRLILLDRIGFGKGITS
jgi:hypothetical protein